jgi:hypothetical protein
MKMRLLATGLIASVAMAAAASSHAAEIQLAFPSSAIDSNLYTYTGGGSYPAAGSTVTIGSVNFTLAPFYADNPAAPDVGVVLTGDGSPNTININTPDVVVGASTTFYSLINSAFGVNGQAIGDLTLNFSNGSTYVYDLTEGDNVRDHYDGVYNNVATNVYGTATYGSDRLDAQQIVLPSSYAGLTLTSITLDNNNTGNGDAFIAAFTGEGVTAVTGGVPEPATWAMMVGGLGLVGATIRRRRNIMAVAQA